MGTRPVLGIPRAWQRLLACCGVVEAGRGPVTFNASIQPSVAVDRFPGVRTHRRVDQVNVSGAGVIDFCTVPSGEHWAVWAFRVALSSGTYTFDDWRVNDADRGSVRVESFASASEYLSGVLAQPIELVSGMTLQVNIDSHSASGDLNSQMWVRVYPAPVS